LLNLSLKQNLLASTSIYLILLIVLGGFSLAKLSKVESLAVTQQTKAINLQLDAAILQVLLLKKIKISSAALALTTSSQLKALENDYTELEKEFKIQLAQFSQTQNSSQHSQLTSELSQSASAFARSSAAIFKSVGQTLKYSVEIETRLAEFENQADELGALLLDIAYADNGADSERIEGMVNQLDTSLYSIIGLAKEVYNAQQAPVLQRVEESVDFAVNDFAIKLNYLFQNLDAQQHQESISAIKLQQTRAFQLLSAKAGLIDVRRQLIEASQKIKTAYQAGELHVNNALAQAEQIKSDAELSMKTLQDEAGAMADDAYMTGIVTLIVSLAIGAVTFWLTRKAIVSPLRSMGRVVSAIANGDLTRTLAVFRTDEIGMLSQDINKMAVNLKNLVELIHDASAKLNQAAQSANFDALSLAQQLEESVELVSQSKQHVQSVEQQTNDISDKLDSFSKHMADTSSHIEKGRSQSQQTKKQVETLNQQAQLSGEGIYHLKQRSSEIDKIVESIEKIAEQTNLLALNAAIESARAGEQGRGFAVVADEVRQLAARTQDSTVQIQTIISEIQKEIEVTFTSMQSGITESKQVSGSIESLDSLMQHINDEVILVQAEFAQAMDYIRHQRAAIGEVGDLVEQIANISTQNLTTADDTLEQSKEINNATKELREVVAKFKTE